MNWTPIEELKDKHETRLLLCAPELVDLDCNPDGIGMGYWQDDALVPTDKNGRCGVEGVDYGAFLACKWNMTNDEWMEVPCTPTHFIVMSGPKKPSRFHSEIEDAELELLSVRDDYVRRFGWQHTCNTPGSYWMWRRDFAKEDNERMDRWRDSHPTTASRPVPYGIVTVTLEHAVTMTARCLDEQPEAGDDE